MTAPREQEREKERENEPEEPPALEAREIQGLHLLEDPYPFLDGWMGGEQALEPMVPFSGHSRRLVEPEMGRGVVRYSHRGVVGGDLSKRAGQPRRIPGQHGSFRVGQ